MEKQYAKTLWWLGIVVLLGACTSRQQQGLPYYGEKEVTAAGDSVYYTVPSFSFVDQDGNTVTQETVKGKVHVVDFFFTTCPTICPRMKDQMLRVYKEFHQNDRVKLLSHTIDPRHDSVAVLREFAYEKLELEPGMWHLVTGEQQQIYDMARAYMVVANEDGTEPGGFVHSGKFILLDQEGHIRGYYDGTDPLAVADLMRDMNLLLATP